MRRLVPDQSRILLTLVAALLMHAATAGRGTAEDAAAATAAADLLRQSCGDCHCDGAEEGGIAIDRLLGRLAAEPEGTAPPGHAGLAGADDVTAWVSVWKNLRAGIMPPSDAAQPSAEERQAMERYLETTVLGVDRERPDPGEIVLRRLNRVEYANTVRDLTGVDIDVTFELPPDDTGYGFDTIGAVLSISPLLLEKYVAVAGRVAETIAAEARPNDAGEYPEAYRRLFPAGRPPAEASEREDHLRTTLRKLADRGYRRPVDDETLDRLMAVAAGAGDETTPFEHRIAAAAAAVIASPRFLFRIEDAAEPQEPQPNESLAVPVDEFSLASRLSYFLWSTMPDDELFTLAAEGRLRQELDAQVARLIADPRSNAFVENFVGQWLQTRDVETLPFDLETVFIVNEEGGEERRRRGGGRRFSYHLRQAIKRETEMLFAHLLREGLPATDLITGRSTFLNEDLARFYGIPGIEGRSMQLVELPEESHRRGLLTQASFLMVTSNPSRTSPVKRGLFILTNLLGTPPPPAPPDVPALEEAVADVGEQATMRELMVRHRADPLCASCHKRMDPLGLALEQYNAIGQWRGEQAATVDTAGMLITGESFGSVQELANTIAGARKRDFLRCLTEKLLTYALGRGVEYFDTPAVDTIVEEAEAGGSLAGMVKGVVSSVPFQCRRR
jgi:mono/diheme cytochrome c family protein